jgi:hypothetical protein
LFVFHGRENSGERVFREAFERLKRGNPEVLPQGAPLTQSNVAREARRNPCALAKHKYPALIEEIQDWIRNNVRNDSSPAKVRSTIRERDRDLELLTIQRDLALSMLVQADSRILQLTRQLEGMKMGGNANGLVAA